MEVLELAITYPESETRCSAIIRRIDGRFWAEVSSTQKLGVEMIDASTQEQALMFALAMCGVAATVHDVNRGIDA